MRVLFLHPDDDPDHGPWLNSRWDRVFDLALASPADYARWMDNLRCPVIPIPRSDLDDFRRIRQILSVGLGRLIDDRGFDWWDLLLLRFYEELERVLALQKVVAACSSRDEILVSRPGLHSELLKHLSAGPVSTFPHNSGRIQFLRIPNLLRKLKFADMLQIAGDKYDASYRFRRLLARRETASSAPLILLPSAYANASKTALSYARALPDVQFLLVATRSSAIHEAVPENVRVARLASYAPSACSQPELRRLLDAWCDLRASFREHQQLSILDRIGLFNHVPALLKEGLSIRDAWFGVFTRESIASVLSADEGNPYTRLPLLIAKQQAKPALACHHGALDLRYLVRNCVADRFLAKNRMEADYLTRVCGLPRDGVEVASHSKSPPLSRQSKKQGDIIFFSEPYELSAIRTPELYRDVLPRLVRLAAQHGCKLMLKLHPFESRRERQKLAQSVLSPQQGELLQIVDSPLTADLLQQAWFGVAASSTAVVDCALNAVPAFLLTWLDVAACGYSRQFQKFRAAAPLGTPEQISRIPDLLAAYSPPNLDDLSSGISSSGLREVLLPSSSSLEPNCAEMPEAMWA